MLHQKIVKPLCVLRFLTVACISHLHIPVIGLQRACHRWMLSEYVLIASIVKFCDQQSYVLNILNLQKVGRKDWHIRNNNTTVYEALYMRGYRNIYVNMRGYRKLSERQHLSQLLKDE